MNLFTSHGHIWPNVKENPILILSFHPIFPFVWNSLFVGQKMQFHSRTDWIRQFSWNKLLTTVWALLRATPALLFFPTGVHSVFFSKLMGKPTATKKSNTEYWVKHIPVSPCWYFYGFSDLPRPPAPLHDHGLFQLKVKCQNTTTTSKTWQI